MTDLPLTAGEPTDRVAGGSSWLHALRRFLIFTAAANLVWEFAQMPLYTLWYEGTAGEIVFAAVHCTGGDILIASTSLLLAFLLAARPGWPRATYKRVAALTIGFALPYTVFSEWLNTEIRGSWAYAELMLVVPVVGAGLSPVAQWIVIPIAAFWWAARLQSKSMRIMRMTPLKLRYLLPAALVVAAVSALFVTRSHSDAGTTVESLAQETHFHGIAVDQNDPSRLYLATHHGLYAVTQDGSANLLSPVQDFMGFSPHPSDPSTLYASGHPSGGGNLGFIVSDDGGGSWTQLAEGVGGPVDFHQMDVSPADPKTIYGAHAGGLQVSEDGGQSWRMVGQAPEGLIDLAASSENADTLYAATQGGLLKSEDGGRTWQRAYWLRQPATMVHVAPGGTVYAFVAGTGLIRTTQPALSWQTISEDAFGRAYLLHFAVDPTSDSKLYAISFNPESDTQAVLASNNAGKGWAPLANPSH